MIRCDDCPCMYTVQRKYGITNYCEEANKNKENPLCPLVNTNRHCGIDISHAKEDDNDEST